MHLTKIQSNKNVIKFTRQRTATYWKRWFGNDDALEMFAIVNTIPSEWEELSQVLQTEKKREDQRNFIPYMGRQNSNEGVHPIEIFGSFWTNAYCGLVKIKGSCRLHKVSKNKQFKSQECFKLFL